MKRRNNGHDRIVTDLLIFLVGIIFLLAFAAWSLLWAYSSDQRDKEEKKVERFI